MNSNTLQCGSCGEKVTTRIAIGWSEYQEHALACPNCGVEIRVYLDIDQENQDFKYRQPLNSEYVEYDEDAPTVTFDADFPVPRKDMFFSPFMSVCTNFKNADGYEHYCMHEKHRRTIRQEYFPIVERMLVHYSNGNLELFKNDAKELGYDPRKFKSSKSLLYKIDFDISLPFLINEEATIKMIDGRIQEAYRNNKKIFEKVKHEFVDSGRYDALIKQRNDIRKSFLELYPALSPLLQIPTWKEKFQIVENYSLSQKRFSELKQLYIDCFETFCRLSTLAIGVDNIIEHKSLMIPCKKNEITLWDYESMHNGNKPDILKKYPIGYIFVEHIDAKLRNGIGHHSAHYDVNSDEIVYYRFKDSMKVEYKIDYTVFCFKLLKLYSAFSAAKLYLNIF